MGVIVRAIGAGVGFIAEATSNNSSKTPKTSERSIAAPTSTRKSSHPRQLTIEERERLQDENDDDDSDSDSISSLDSGDDETVWALDDASSSVQPPRLKKKTSNGASGQPSVNTLVTSVLQKTRPPPYQIPPLSLPVILPQRRPGDRGRGFIRAYAPSLDQYGIDQDTFLSFVENFDEAVKASPYLTVIYLGAGAVGFVPHGWAILASTLAQVVVGSAMEYQKRSRGNSFMDQINDKLFKPRGLYAVVMTYVPNAERPVTAKSTDFQALVNGTSTAQGSLLGPKVQKGESYGELELPEAAPLVFPGIDKAKKAQLMNENALKKSASWTQDYLDRRGQARWMHQNPSSRLNPAPEMKPSFKSDLADPNHPAFAGSWPTLFSGGRIAPKQKLSKDQKRAMKQERRDAKRARQGKLEGYEAAGPNGAGNVQRRQKKKGKKAKSKILYLMILPIEGAGQQA